MHKGQRRYNVLYERGRIEGENIEVVLGVGKAQAEPSFGWRNGGKGLFGDS